MAVGHPSADMLPHAVLAAAAEAAAAKLRTGPAGFHLNYGRTAGEKPVVSALAAWLTRRGDAGDAPVRPDRLFITGGVSHGLDLACATLSQPGDCIVVVRPTYFLASNIFRNHGLRVVDVPSDDAGLDLAALGAVMAREAPRLLYIVPTHANPTGCTLPPAARAALVELATQHGCFILADEVYHHLTWSGSLPARMRAWDAAQPDEEEFDGEDRPMAAGAPAERVQPQPGGLVVSCSSFTKTLAPGVRVGWIEAAPAVLRAIAGRAYLVSGGGVAPLSSLVVLEALLSGGMDAHLEHLKHHYSRRCGVLCDALRAATADAGWSFVQPSGGYFLWLRLPPGVTGAALASAAKARALAVLDGARCCGVGEHGAAPAGGVADVAQHVRLCFALLDEAQLRDGVARLAAAVEDVRAQQRAAL